MTTGYSGTPLARKLSLKDGMRVWWDGMPPSVRAEIEALGCDLQILPTPEPPIDMAHIFVDARTALAHKLDRLIHLIARDGMIWVSWPKKAAKVQTDISEDVIRGICLPMGLVDVKVCSVDNIWSGLKLVIRKDLR